MHNNYKIRFLVLSFFLFPALLYSQDPPIEWGKIPRVDLEMKSFPEDTNAAAVILCDYGESYINNSINLEYSRIMRVKILNSNGFKWGSHAIEIYTKDSKERVFDIEGATYNLDGNGKVITSELDDDDIFKEKVSDSETRYRFTLPNLKPGCVIEIKYKIESNSLFLTRGWTFQYDEPVLWSEYRFSFPPNIVYAGAYSGYEPWYYSNIDQVKRHFEEPAAGTLGGGLIKCYQYRYVVKNAPAIRKEPYITTVDDYVNKVDIQLSGYSFISTGKQDVLKTWNSVVSDLVDADEFYDRIDVTGDVESLASKITTGLTSPEEKMKAIYNWITHSIVWDGKNRIFASNDVDDVLELKKGNNSEITFLLLSLLKSVGIQGCPVILSTRTNGKIQKVYPIVSQFNYDIAKVVIGNHTYFLDATDPFRPIDVLPVKIIGSTGLVIKDSDDPVEWVTFSTDKSDLTKTLINVKVDQDGSLSGNIEDLCGDYRSLSVRDDLTGESDIDLVKNLFDSESQGFSIDSVTIGNKDSLELPVKIKTQISSSTYAQKSGDMIYINPFMVYRLKENPFKTKIRRFPVDYAYKRSHLIVMNFDLPEGYELKEPLNRKVFYVGSSIMFSRMMEVKNNIVQIICKMDVKDSQISSDEYDKLRNFYSQVVSAESEQLVIGPKVNPAENTDPSSKKVNVGSK
jgi:transglutaminase-like putative cysteine protease